MVQKRQLAEDEYVVSPKHLKLENSFQLVPCLQFPFKDVLLKPIGTIEPGLSYEPFESFRQFGNEKPIFVQERLSKPKTSIQPENSFSRLLYFSPLKQTPIGPEYQADIPEWCGNDKTIAKNKFIGSCIILIPETNLNIRNDDHLVGKGRTDCQCEDRDSYRCVRKHITKARDSLRVSIGQERFSALGFDSMGDTVSSKWTEKDEQLFHEAVYSNPRKNLWEKLTETFPSRPNREIVSYYFNVLVLQKRAEQNRFDPMNADSDDDEWQGNDGVGESEDDDEDLCRDEIEKYGFNVKDSLFEELACAPFGFEESQKRDGIFDHLDCKVWDVGCFSFPKAEFLPTGSMIEEVFGVESWNFKLTDNQNG